MNPILQYRRVGRSLGASGFSLIEVMVAAGILFIVAIGLIPLFSRALISNQAGADATRSSQEGISQVERLYQLDFNNAVLNPGTSDEYYLKSDGLWHAGTPPAGVVTPWTRTTTVQQFNLGDLDDDGVFNGSVPAGPDPVFIHIKQIDVRVVAGRDPRNPIGTRRGLTLRTLKPF